MVRLAAVSYLPTSIAASGSSRHSAVRNWLLNTSNDLSWRRSDGADGICVSATAAATGATVLPTAPWRPCATFLAAFLPWTAACALLLPLLPCVVVAAWAVDFL